MKRVAIFFLIVLLFFSCEKGNTNAVKKTANQVVKSEKINVNKNAPAIKFKETVYDAGEVIEGEKVPHSFVFENVGHSVLTISSVRSTCGCTVAKLEKKIYNPGESGKIDVVFNSHGYSGNVLKTIYVFTNDPLQPKIQLSLKCFVKKYINFNPRLLYFGEVNYGDKKTMSVIFKGGVAKHFKITKIELPVQLNNIMTYKITPLTNKENISEYRVDFTLTAKNIPLKTFSYSILIHTDAIKMPIIFIQARGAFVGPISFFPKAINFNLKRGNILIYTINLTSKKQFNINKAYLSLREENKNIKVNVNTLKKRYAYTISIFSYQPLMRGIHGQLIIETNMKDQTKINIPLNIRVF